MSLPGLMVAVALFAVLVLVAIKAVLYVQAVRVQMAAEDELLQVKMLILRTMDCTSITINSGPNIGERIPACTEPDPNDRYFEVSARKSSGPPLVPRYIEGEAFRPWLHNVQMRASCGPCPLCSGGYGVKFEYRLRQVKGADVTQAGWRPAFSGVPGACVVPW
jgi:hypothetical protein